VVTKARRDVRVDAVVERARKLVEAARAEHDARTEYRWVGRGVTFRVVSGRARVLAAARAERADAWVDLIDAVDALDAGRKAEP
jgi:hypothetical protein